MYHRIADESFDPWGLAVGAERFAAQMEWLARNRAVMPLHEFAEHQRTGQLPPSAVSITFDDGYACSLHAAAPVLESFNLSATIFLPADLIERRGPFWWDELARIVLDFSGYEFEVDGVTLAVPAAEPGDPNWQPDRAPSTPRQSLFNAIWSRLHKKDPDALDAAMSQLRGQVDGDAHASHLPRPLTVEEISGSASPAITFGSHALTHPSLPSLDRDTKQREIAESRSRCASLSGSTPAAFAYPHGDLDQECLRMVEEAGYSFACATGDAFVTNRSNIFALPRLRVGNWEAAHLRDMLGG
jgi:peptidoglycan/xylan/chitin deacetylase (PgdA/CDA1 family)